jgi:hypothetical protein
MRFATETAVTVYGGHKGDSLIQIGHPANLFKLALQDKNVREVDGFPEGNGSDKHVNEAKRVQIPSLFVLAQFFDAGGYPDLGTLKQTEVIPAPDYATHIAVSGAIGIIAWR